MLNIPRTSDLFNIEKTTASELFKKHRYPHLVLGEICDFIEEWSKRENEGFDEILPGVFAHKTAKISSGVSLTGPAIICQAAELRPGAYVRGGVIIGKGAVIGNSTELKNTVVFDEAQLPHYNYVGDSIIGYKSHMGAGVIASNLRLDRSEVPIGDKSERIGSGRRKLGVMLGDMAEVGCGTVICPGTVIGRKAVIYPLCCVKGIVGEDEIIKSGVK